MHQHTILYLCCFRGRMRLIKHQLYLSKGQCLCGVVEVPRAGSIVIYSVGMIGIIWVLSIVVCHLKVHTGII